MLRKAVGKMIRLGPCCSMPVFHQVKSALEPVEQVLQQITWPRKVLCQKLNTKKTQDFIDTIPVIRFAALPAD